MSANTQPVVAQDLGTDFQEKFECIGPLQKFGHPRPTLGSPAVYARVVRNGSKDICLKIPATAGVYGANCHREEEWPAHDTEMWRCLADRDCDGGGIFHSFARRGGNQACIYFENKRDDRDQKVGVGFLIYVP